MEEQTKSGKKLFTGLDLELDKEQKKQKKFAVKIPRYDFKNAIGDAFSDTRLRRRTRKGKNLFFG
jgi:hypothetical protein